ncbi:hypothetical protein CHS0354_030864 [Potamilus streckersoni]|uniref:Mitochondria-eating protein n=1 Tax=Potamilus streckersoni TaxID=2493646 RepID=A0AAE0SN82_9BIVA|nr:hypothetical protein CHS0354_030864 [Potamilus streckersoni]
MDVIKAKVRKLRKMFSRKEEDLSCARKEDVSKEDLDEMSRRYEEELQIYSRKVKQLEKEKNDLLIRLSSYAAARLTNENPYNTDLSNQNRPNKLSERYSELYDNHWTDAFQNLQDKHHLSETNAIEFLLDVLFVSFDECKNDRLRESAIEALNEYIGSEKDDPQDLSVLEVMKTLKDTKKRNIKRMQKVFKIVENRLAERKIYTTQRLQDIRPYLDECVELCFLMNIQEPPLELRGLMYTTGTPFDDSAFQPYTKSGKKIEYVVWPAMHLYRDGPLLCRGIAQGMPDPYISRRA